MTTTIEKIIYAIYPEYRAVAMLCAEDIEGIGRLIEKRVSGSGDAVIVYGFDKKERLINGQIGTILNTPGIFYLKLPAVLADIEQILFQAAFCNLPKHIVLDAQTIAIHIIPRIREVKHRCDNVWITMNANAEIAKRALAEGQDERYRAALLKFKIAKIEKLNNDYNVIESMVRYLGITGAENIPSLMTETISAISQIENESVSVHEAAKMAAKCAANIQSVAEILSQAKELTSGN